MHPWTLYAIEVMRDRERDAYDQWARHEQRSAAHAEHDAARTSGPRRPGLRRPAAIVLATLSRGTASAVRRLDDCVADDLGRALAPTE